MGDVEQGPIVIAHQGARAYGGTVIRDEIGRSVHVDHVYDEWQVPVDARQVPLILWHSSSTWTWDASYSGGDGFRNIFLRRGFPVHVIDAPQLGRAGWASRTYRYEPEVGYDQMIYNGFRIGVWVPPAARTYYDNVQFPKDDDAVLEQLFRAAYPEFNVPDNVLLQGEEVAKLVDAIGGGVLVTHSGSGLRGWWTALHSDHVKAIVSYEPNSFVLPEGEVPEPLERADGKFLSAHNDPLGSAVPLEQFMKLTAFPIQIVFGDNIATEMRADNVGPLLTLDNRRLGVIRSHIFADAVNRHGGNAEVLMLPDAGLSGNTHFPMQDLNNVEVADLLFEFLDKHGLAEPDGHTRRRH
jgi:hypothetical protein